MDKRQLQTFAVWAKENLEQQIEVSLKSLGINSASDIKAARRMGDVTVIDGDPNSYPADLFSRRDSIVRLVREKGYQYIIEEFAYTWFNRLVALRFMEVHNYLPHGFRVLSSTSGSVEPDILRNLPFVKDELRLDITLCARLKEQNETEALFRYVLLKQCAALSEILPMLFEKSTEDMGLLLPKSLLIGDTVLTRLVAIPEENFLDDVQIVGWLYQYYNTEPKNRVFANLKKNIKISKHDIPAATQLFTPDWIVRYMVENSLGRLWVEGHPNDQLKAGWKYYLEEESQEPKVRAELEEIRKSYAALRPQDLLCMDCCMGSGHILVYMFEVLMQIYETYGFSKREAAANIVQRNLWGLDIDDRAAQLANFAVVMKARQYDRGWFQRGIQPHVMAIQESNSIDRAHLHFLGNDLNSMERNIASTQMEALLDEFIDAKEFGSILQPQGYDFDLLRRYVMMTSLPSQTSMAESGIEATQEYLLQLVEQAQMLAQQYHVTSTNPPYMGGTGMSPKLMERIKAIYEDCKSDLFAVFIDRCMAFCKQNGKVSMVTMNSWMFLSSFENIRIKMLSRYQIETINHLGMEAFDDIIGKVVQTVAFTLGYYSNLHRYRASAVRLTDFYDARRWEKEQQYFNPQNRYQFIQENFHMISGSPIAYWTSERVYKVFATAPSLDSFAEPRQGVKTLDNDRFLKLWFEVELPKISFTCSSISESIQCRAKWFPYNKGGAFRKWYGNNEYVVNWENDGQEMKAYAVQKYNSVTRTITNIPYFFRNGLTWSSLTNGSFSLRRFPKGYIFDSKGSSMFFDDKKTEDWVYGLLNSKVAMHFFAFLAPTLDFNVGPMRKIPIITDESQMSSVQYLVDHATRVSKEDWDAFETSWDFRRHSLIDYIQVEERESATVALTPNGEEMVPTTELCIRLETAFHEWERIAQERFDQLKASEEELNRIFIDIYGLQDELTPEVADEDVTVRLADKQRDVRSLISYLVGVVMGRYSLDEPGLAYAGGNWDASKYRTYQPDDDGIVPIYRGIGMDDGMTARLIKLIKRTYGEESYRENMEFIAEALGKKTNESAEETLNRYLNDGFYADHLKVYQKRPIYWLFTSGKNGGFKCLIYMHRYNQDTLARINGKYFLPESTRLKHDLEDIDQRISVAEGSERVRLEKERQRLMACYQEALAYGQVLDHMANKYITIDLDDGVKVNYAKFQGVEMVTDGGSRVKMDLLAPLK